MKNKITLGFLDIVNKIIKKHIPNFMYNYNPDLFVGKDYYRLMADIFLGSWKFGKALKEAFSRVDSLELDGLVFESGEFYDFRQGFEKYGSILFKKCFDLAKEKNLLNHFKNLEGYGDLEYFLIDKSVKLLGAKFLSPEKFKNTLYKDYIKFKQNFKENEHGLIFWSFGVIEPVQIYNKLIDWVKQKLSGDDFDYFEKNQSLLEEELYKFIVESKLSESLYNKLMT